MSETEQVCTALRDVITLAAAGACGKKVNTEPADWEAVFRLAHEHHVVPLLGCALLNSPELPCPEQYREYALNIMRNASSSSIIRKQRVYYLLHELQDAGINSMILKGYAAARFYAYPECRDAGDTDLLIDPTDEKRTNAFLLEKGFQILERNPTSHHAIAAHPKYGKLEIHVSLYDEIVENIWFQYINQVELIQEESIKVEETEGAYETLGDTDHLIFITLHMIKHFIGSGLTVRMLLDVALYFVQNGKTINAQRFWDVIERLKYTGIVNGVFSLLVQQGIFSADDFPGMREQEAEVIELLIEDLLLGGYMGSKETSDRHTAAMIYNRKLALRQKNEWQYRAYMVLWKMKSAKTYMFPSKKFLTRLYPMVKRYPALNLPFRLYQFIAFPIKKLRSGIIKQEIRIEGMTTAEVANRRLELFKQLGLI